MATPAQIMDALASQIQAALCGTADPAIEQLQVDGRLIISPTPPAIDIYPGDPFQEQASFKPGDKTFNFIVRVRVSTADDEGGQDLLLSMMDPTAATSLAKAIEANRTLGNVVGNVLVEGPSGFGVFPEASGTGGSLLGCTWTATVYP
jgi:hypothetical protein